MQPGALKPLDRARLLDVVRSPGLAVMLYGSRARGDYQAESDIDLLQLAEQFEDSYQVGPISVTVYTPDQLGRMCEAGSLFALHLINEGEVLIDETGTLRETLARYRAPPSYDALVAEVVAAARILDASPAEVATNTVGFVRLGLYLVRTMAIVRHIENFGTAMFSIPALAADLEVPQLNGLFAGRELPENLNVDRLNVARMLLESHLGVSAANPFGSLEALAVNLEVNHATASRLALRILAGERTLGYGDLLLEPVMPPDD